MIMFAVFQEAPHGQSVDLTVCLEIIIVDIFPSLFKYDFE